MKMKDQRKFAHLSTGIFWHGSGAFGKNIPRQYSWLFYFKRWSQLLVARLHRPVQQCCIQRFGPCKTKGSWTFMRAANWAGFFPKQTGRGLVFVCLCGIETLVWVNFRDLTNLTPQSRWFEWESFPEMILFHLREWSTPPRFIFIHFGWSGTRFSPTRAHFAPASVTKMRHLKGKVKFWGVVFSTGSTSAVLRCVLLEFPKVKESWSMNSGLWSKHILVVHYGKPGCQVVRNSGALEIWRSPRGSHRSDWNSMGSLP